MRNGANLEADDSSYWGAIAQFYPTLSSSDQQELGYKLLKRLWLWSAWAHIADTSGKVRRAIAFTSRDYWDAGTLTALDPLTSLIQTIVPTKPLGAALYYSTSVERAIEAKGPNNPVTGAVSVYFSSSNLSGFIDAGGTTGYYVSDAALSHIKSGSANAPSAWIVLDAQGYLPATEQNELAAIAPVVTSAAALAALPGQPLKFSAGLTGFGFFDQNGKRNIVVTNPSTLPNGATISGTMTLMGLSAGTHTMKDQFTGAITSFTATSSGSQIPMVVQRWDTRAFQIVN